MARLLYLHGFASSPASHKATYFRRRLADEGIPLEIPDLNEGDFRHLTLTRQLRLIECLANGESVFLIGSSMGGYLAALYAAQHPEVVGTLLLAPAFNFYERWLQYLGPEKIAEWRASGEIMVYNYAEGREVPLSVDLLEDARKYEAFPAVGQPCLIFHGVNDTVVPIEYSKRFKQQQSSASLRELQSGHELTDVLEMIWAEARPDLIEANRR